MDFKRNNLDTVSSPYLRQHANNPIWWQPWSQDVLEYAQRAKKVIFVSVGYSTCHWCHVMAREAFSDLDIAQNMNDHFVCIKVDREERPDIDQFLMNFLISISGHGGWPLNAFLTPDILNPIYAFTYAPVESMPRSPGFLEIVRKVYDFYMDSGQALRTFLPQDSPPPTAAEDELITACYSSFDNVYGGFGTEQKFPSHCTMLYLFNHPEDDDRIRLMIEKTLDAMMLGGLHDHLQGGFFRYCVDRSWGIPHFEKMLYDQAMLLWVYSLAYHHIRKDAYRETALKIILALENTFEEDGLFITAHDADTDHEEGATYLWSWDELRRVLTPEEFSRFHAVYSLSPGGNFKGLNHLVRKDSSSLPGIESKLLALRRQRPQPARDRKIITSWNALTGIAFVHAYRYLGDKRYLKIAETIARNLLERHFDGDSLTLSRWSLDGKRGGQVFLEDAAALLLFLTYLQEDSDEWGAMMNVFFAYVEKFRVQDGWKESAERDLFQVPASRFDHPIPSSVSMAELAVLRVLTINRMLFERGPYAYPVYYDFYNIAALLRNGLFHVITSPHRLDWSLLPVNSIQIRGERIEDCFDGSCRPVRI